MADDPLGDAIRSRKKAQEDAQAAAQRARIDTAEQLDRAKRAAQDLNRHLRPLGRSFVERARGIPTEKIYVGAWHEAQRGLFKSGTEWVSGRKADAWVIETLTTSSSGSTGSTTSGAVLFVLKDGQVITGYRDERAIADRMAAYLERHGR